MIFTKLKIENYGLFRGEHIFELTPTKEKPIILFGGKNGSGKTTLFEAFKVCLYGNTFRGSSISNTKYEKFLQERIHHYSGLIIQPDYASITLEFKYSQFGNIDNYIVKRFWKNNGNGVLENLEIYKNDQLLEDIENYQWQDFVKELIPQGVTKLFFFDGEQIQNLAEDDRNNTHLKDSFTSLLGLDVIERLQLDLRILISRMQKEPTKDDEKTLEELTLQKEQLRREIDIINTNAAQIQNQIEHISGRIERQEQRITNEGGGYVNKREHMKSRKEFLDTNIKNIEEQIREMASTLLPFALTPEYARRLRDHLLLEEEYQQQLAAKKSLEKKLLQLHDRLASEEFWHGIKVDDELKLYIIQRLTRSIDELIQSDIKKVNVIHNLSEPEREKLMSWINEVLTTIPTRLKVLTQDLEKLTRERIEIEKSLFRSPPDEVLHPLLQELNKLYAEFGTEQQKLVQIKNDITSKQFKLTQIELQINKIYERLKHIRKVSEKEELIHKTQLLLDDYLTQLRERKLNMFSENLLTSLNHLIHKNIFEKVIIDKDLSITLYTNMGDIICKGQFSAGEKQIYAIAILWALARTSRRPLPFIIDTPLARLDSNHRLNLVSNFFPYASHQVIIFSTDTEIDRQYFNELQPYISKTYHLEYNKEEGRTNVSTGYFYRDDI